MEELKLYCQNCCARYFYCIWKDTLHLYDRSAETCPDFIPKDIYKAIKLGTEKYITNISKTPCFHKRLIVEPDYKPLPDNIPISHYTKDQLEEARRYAIKKQKEEEIM